MEEDVKPAKKSNSSLKDPLQSFSKIAGGDSLVDSSGSFSKEGHTDNEASNTSSPINIPAAADSPGNLSQPVFSGGSSMQKQYSLQPNSSITALSFTDSLESEEELVKPKTEGEITATQQG